MTRIRTHWKLYAIIVVLAVLFALFVPLPQAGAKGRPAVATVTISPCSTWSMVTYRVTLDTGRMFIVTVPRLTSPAPLAGAAKLTSVALYQNGVTYRLLVAKAGR